MSTWAIFEDAGSRLDDTIKIDLGRCIVILILADAQFPGSKSAQSEVTMFEEGEIEQVVLETRFKSLPVGSKGQVQWTW
jgi:hypothetical protein